MNKKFSSWLITLVIALAGILLISWHNEVGLFSWLIRAIGIILTVPAVYILLSALSALRYNRLKAEALISDDVADKSKLKFKSRPVAWSLIIVSVATILFGFWMLVNPGFFGHLISYLFAIVIIIFGVLQIIDLTYLSRPVMLPIYFYIMPALLITTGLVIMFTKFKTIDHAVTLTTGIMLLLYSISRIAQYIVYRSELNKISKLSDTGNTDDEDNAGSQNLLNP